MNQYTPEQFSKLKKYWKQYEEARDEYDNKVARLEEKMSIDTGIPDIEFGLADGWVFGIGNAYAKDEDRYPTIDGMYLTGEEEYEAD